MKCLVYKYRCDECERWFEHYNTLPHSYGEFLLRTKNGHSERYLNALSDPVYDEVDQLLKDEPRLAGLSDLDRSEVLRRVFGIACDPDHNGDRLDMEQQYSCVFCGSENFPYWEATEPPKIVDVEVVEVTHHFWNTLTTEDKIKVVQDELDKLHIPKVNL